MGAKREEAAATKPGGRSRAGAAFIGGSGMTYDFILRSLQAPDGFYVGVTNDLRARLRRHNAGEVSHTSTLSPWEIKTYLAFTDEEQAHAVERYLKSGSGSAFATKRL